QVTLAKFTNVATRFDKEKCKSSGKQTQRYRTINRYYWSTAGTLSPRFKTASVDYLGKGPSVIEINPHEFRR
ncbi:MAG TPA: hypothetical protein PLO20_04345, partial [Thermogutta sp.]|nr:hypothetical protein [Thermogutta sp.]